MAIPADLDPANIPDSPTTLDPSETLTPRNLSDLGASLARPLPRPATLEDLGRALRGDTPIDVSGPVPQTPEGLRLMHQKLAWESENLPAAELTPEGQNPRIRYPQGETSDGFVKDTEANLGLVALRAGAGIGRKAAGLADIVGVPGARDLANTYGSVQRGLGEVSREAGGLPLLAPIAQNVIETSPELVAGAVGKLPGLAISFGLGAAGNAFETAQDADYPHPEAYALLSGVIAAGTSLLPGYKGRNLVAAGNQLMTSPTWRAYGQELASQYQSNIFKTHGGSTALMMGVQSVLQSLLDKQTINPDITWKDIVAEAAQSIGMGAIIGEGFGALSHAANISQHNQVLKNWLSDIEKTQFQDWRTIQPGHEESGYPPGPSLRMQRTAFREPNPYGAGVEGQVLPRVVPPEPTGDESSAYDVVQRNRGSLRLPQGIGTQPVSERVRAPMVAPEEVSQAVAARNALPPVQGPSQIVVSRPEPRVLTPEQEAIERERLAKELGPDNEEPPTVAPPTLRPTTAPTTGTASDVKKAFEGITSGAVVAFRNRLVQQVEKGEAVFRNPKAIELVKSDPTLEWNDNGDGSITVTKVKAVDEAPLTPTMDTARAIVKMPPEEFVRRSSSFNKINLAIGDSATPKDVAELGRLRDQAVKRLQEATVAAKQGGEPEMQALAALSTMPQFYNEAIARAKARRWAAKLGTIKPGKVPEPKPEVATPPRGAVNEPSPGPAPEWLRDRLNELIKKGWNPKWPFVPADLGNQSFVDAIKIDPALSAEEKNAILSFAPGGKNEITLSGSKPVALPPPIPQAVAPANQLPKRGQRVQLGQYYVKLATSGRYVLLEEGNPNWLARLKKATPEALTQEALGADIAASTKGQATKYWEVRSDRLGKAKEEIRQENLGSEDYSRTLISSLGSSPEEQALKAMLHSGALSQDAAIGLVNELTRGSLTIKGKELAKKGPEVLARALRQVAQMTVKKYVTGKLVERLEAGQTGKVPRELHTVTRSKADDGTIIETPTGGLKSEKEVRAMYPDAKMLAARALSILVRNREIANQKHLERKNISIDQDNTEELTAKKSRDLAAPTEEITQFSDEDIKGKEAAAERVDEIKKEVLGKDNTNYDEGIKILTDVFGFKPKRARDWMNSSTTFLAPGQKRVAARNLSPAHYETEKQLRGPFRLLGPEVVALKQILPTNRAGILNGDQTTAVLKVHLSPAELEWYATEGLGNFLAGGVTPDQLIRWMQTVGPKVAVVTGVASEAPWQLSAESQRLAELDHTFFDAQPEDMQGYIRHYMAEHYADPESADTRSWRAQIFDALTAGWPDREAFRGMLDEYVKLSERHPEQRDDLGRAHWSYIAPKPEAQMPGYVEIAVTIPIKPYGPDSEYRSKEMFPGTHQFPVNTLGWVRGYLDGKTFRIIEVQSDWAQHLRKQHEYRWERGAPREIVNPHPLLRDWQKLALKAAIDHAIKVGAESIAVDDAETAMLTEGHDQGAMAVRRVTAKQVEHNGRTAILKMSYMFGDDWERGTYVEVEIHGDRVWYRLDKPEENPPGDRQMARELAEAGYGQKEGNYIPQEGGMRLNYDKILPKLLEDLTGERGVVEKFGEHKNAWSTSTMADFPELAGREVTVQDSRGQPEKGRISAELLLNDENEIIAMVTGNFSGSHTFDIEHIPEITAAERAKFRTVLERGSLKPRPDLIFREASGTPKTESTARVYSLEKVKAGQRPGIDLLLGGKLPVVSENANAPFAGEFERGPLRSAIESDFNGDRARFARYRKLGLLADNPLPALKVIAGSDSLFAPLAKIFLQFHGEFSEMPLGNIGGNSRAMASYNPDTNAIRIGVNPDIGTKERIIENFVHEVGHGLLVRRLAVLPEDHPLRQEITSILDSARKEYVGDDPTIHYALSNENEFLTMAFSSPEVIEFLASTKPTSLWQRFVAWVKQVIFGQQPLDTRTSKALGELLKRPPVGKVEWLEQYSKLSPLNYPEIRKVRQFNEAAEYAREFTPEEEKVILTRKALANNNWLTSPDVQAILNGMPKDARARLSAVVDQRLDVIRRVGTEPGATTPSRLQDILADPSLDNDRKAEISRSVLANLLWFKHQSGILDASVLNKSKALVNDLEKLDKGINESSAQMVAGENAIENLITDFKEAVIRDKQKAVDVERAEQLNNQLAMADEMKGNQRSAFHKLMDALAQRIDLETLLSTEDPKELAAHISAAFPPTPENVQELGVSADTIQRAGLIMARSNTLREELLTLKLLRDADMKKGVFSVNKEVNDEIRAGGINKVIDRFSVMLRRITTRQERAAAIYRTLYADKLRRIKAIAKAATAAEALGAIQKTQSFRDLDNLVTNSTGLLKPMAVRLPSGQMQFTHPLTRQHVVIGYDFQRDGEWENLQKLSDVVDAAKLYVANPESKHYTPEEAAFWRGIVRDSAFLLDPALSYNARKLVGAKLDPYKLVNFTGSMLMVPEQILRRVGGRAANELITGLQALSVVDAQLGNLIRRWNAPMSLTADRAAKAHQIPIEQWHNEVLNPLIASRQTTGYEPVRVGSKTIYGHTVLPEDEAAFQSQRAFDREVVKIALHGQGNPAVAADAAKITFKAPGSKGSVLQRPVMASGPDTMSRRLDYQTKNWATTWFNDTSMEGRKNFLDAHLVPIVIGHASTVGAPDYAVRSTMPELYKAAMRKHRATPLNSVDEVLDAMFGAQPENVDPQYQTTREGILAAMINELTAVFNKVRDYNPGTPKPDVGALLRVVDTDNSFTQERGRLIAPTTFYNYGLTFDHNRIARMHSAKAYYTLNIAGKNGLVDKLIASIGEQRNRFKTQIESMVRGGTSEGEAVKTVKKQTKAAQIKGDLLLNYSETLDAYRKLNQFKAELERMLTKTGAANDPDARQLAQTAQSFVAANVLAGVQSQNTNAFGGLANLMLIDKMLLGRSAVSSVLGSVGRALFTKGPIELAALVAKTNPALAKALTSPLAGELGEAIADRIQLHRSMEAYGIAPTANVKQDLRALFEMGKSGGRPQPSNPTLTQKVARGLETGLGAVSIPLSAVAPRLVDRFINELTVWKARDIEDMLRLSAARYGEARESAGMTGTPFATEEIFGKKAPARQEVLLRQLFTRERMSLDNLMWRYYEKYKAAGDKRSVEFFTPEERAAFQFSLAQDVNLPTFANRPVSGKGSKSRNLLGLFWGFPAWQASTMSDYLSKASTDKSAIKYAPTTIAAVIALAALGAASIKVTKELKQFFYGERNDYPDITAANGPGDAAKALTVGLATYLPFLGNLINYVVMNNGVRNGFDINSQFVMLNFASDVFATGKRIIQTNWDFVHPLEDFVRRWSPLARIVVNRLPNQEGLTEYYNLQREARTLAPDGMEIKKRGKPATEATPVTPILQDMVNAAYRNDTAGFMQAAQAYIKYQTDHGMTPDTATQNLRSAWRSRHPFITNFGRMPTAGEEAVIYNNATDDQKHAISLANQVFQTYGDLLGTHFNIVSQDQAALGGRSTAPALPIVQTPPGARGNTSQIGSLVVPSGLTGGAGAAAGGGGGSLLGVGGGSLLGAGRSKGGSNSGPGTSPFKGPAKVSRGTGGGGSLRVHRTSGLKMKIKIEPNLSLRNPKGASLGPRRGRTIHASLRKAKK